MTGAQAELTWFDPTGEATREWHRHGATGEAIRRFFCNRFNLNVGVFGGVMQFSANDLYRFVDAKAGPVAPDTPARVMRLMRQDGMLDYEVINRAKSLYRILGVRVSPTEILGAIRPDGRPA